MVFTVGADCFVSHVSIEIKEVSGKHKNLIIDEIYIRKVFTEEEMEEFIQKGWLIPL